jgi:hypothetical protein
VQRKTNYINKNKEVMITNKYQRAKLRILKDKEAKAVRYNNKNKTYGDFDKVISHQNYFEALGKCRKGVSWKGSVQCYTQNAFIEIDKTISILKSLKLPKLSSNKKIVLYERGKRRVIVPITIKDRMTQRVLCDKSLIPMLSDKLIYDNGASTKGKGVSFARKRVEKHIRQAIKEYGADNVYALVFDFKSFFDSVPHKTCLNILRNTYADKRMVGLIMAIIRSYQRSEIMQIEDKTERQKRLDELNNNKCNGICLGSQISQIMALVVPNELDHFVKDKMRVKHYVRYMDDGFILSNNKEFLSNLFHLMIEVTDGLGLKFNCKKTRIVKMTKGITFMKIKYHITSSGKLIKRLTRAGIVRMRRKLKKLRKLVNKGIVLLDDVYNSFQSWLAHSYLACSYKTRKSMLKLYDELFDGYRITKKFWHLVNIKKKGRNVPYEFLQTDKWERLRWCVN